MVSIFVRKLISASFASHGQLLQGWAVAAHADFALRGGLRLVCVLGRQPARGQSAAFVRDRAGTFQPWISLLPVGWSQSVANCV